MLALAFRCFSSRRSQDHSTNLSSSVTQTTQNVSIFAGNIFKSGVQEGPDHTLIPDSVSLHKNRLQILVLSARKLEAKHAFMYGEKHTSHTTALNSHGRSRYDAKG